MRVFSIGALVYLCTILLTSCTDKSKLLDVKPDADGTELQRIADSVYLFSREIYYWNEIRSTTYGSFNPRQYVKTTALETAEAAIEAVRNTNSYDQDKEYSYATDYYDSEAGSQATQPENSYGFFIKSGWKARIPKYTAFEYDPDFAGWFVTYVFPDSDAGKKGVQRGWKMVKVGTEILKYDNGSIGTLNDMFYSQTKKSANVTFEKPGGGEVTLDLSIGSFTPASVLYSTVLQSPGGTKAGYLVYKFFDRLEDSRAALETALGTFNDAGVKNIILDLRYNNGGFTRTQDFMANSLAPATVSNGKKMYTYYYNQNLQAGNYTLMRTRHSYSATYYKPESNTITFNKTNVITGFPINPAKLFVIVSEQTASSAELLINDLKPYFNGNIKLIGDQNTFGKPVGFFPVDLFKKVTFWAVSFMTKNSVDQQVPFEGFTPDYRVYDGVDKSWGDVTEDCTKAALYLIDGLPIPKAATANTRARALSSIPKVQLRPQYYNNMLRE
ncbi:S41 family peptidase [Niabella aurantiaca]|uniref:S41 family peptidase n=1 Tax=Niabella aurantiaca TaxID=379900 RepID=UPI0003818A8D|nr:S41 family peptidase [Niabella aurantiaca]